MSIARVSIDKWYPCEGRFPAIAICPRCGGEILGSNAPYSVDVDGNVEERVICFREGCDFHGYIRLEQWNRPAVPHA